MGYYNNHSQYYIPALLIAYLYKQNTGKRIRAYLLTAAIWISAVKVWSGGVIMALGVMGLLYLFFKRVHYFSAWLMQILFFIFVVVLKLQNMFRWLIEGWLGKWESLEERMELWDKIFSFIYTKWIIGVGVENSIIRERKVGMFWAVHAHNQILELLYQGGILYLGLFALIVIIAGRKLQKNKNSKEASLIAIAFGGWCTHALVEPFMTPFLMGMFVITYHVCQFYPEKLCRNHMGEHMLNHK